MTALRILIDLQGAQNNSRYRGIGRYSLALAKGIARNVRDHGVFILLNGLFSESIEDIQSSFSGILTRDRFLVLSCPGPVSELNPENAWRRRSAELLREHAIETLSPDVLLITSVVEGAEDNTVTSIGRLPCSVTNTAIIYDLIPLIDPDNYTWRESVRLWYKNKIESLIRADFLFAISQSTMNDAISLLKVDARRISNISSAADSHFSAARVSTMHSEKLLRRLDIIRPYVMHSSAFEPRKNFHGLIKAFAGLPAKIRTKHQLVLVCKLDAAGHEELTKLARSCGMTPRELVLTGFLSDEDLVALYSACRLFVFPSFQEGFGLPALEAMCCGAATIGSSLTSVPEVIGRRDALFDPTSTAQVTALILKALVDDAFYNSLKAHAAEQAAKFSWDETALRAIAGMENAVAQRKLGGQRRMEKQSSRKLLLEALAAVANQCQPTDIELLEVARQIEANNDAVQVMRTSTAFANTN